MNKLTLLAIFFCSVAQGCKHKLNTERKYPPLLVIFEGKDSAWSYMQHDTTYGRIMIDGGIVLRGYMAVSSRVECSGPKMGDTSNYNPKICITYDPIVIYRIYKDGQEWAILPEHVISFSASRVNY